MLFVRRALYLAIGAVGLFGGTVVAVPDHVSATTGPTQFLPATKYKVNNKIEQLYTGQYVIKSVNAASRLHGGAMGIEINTNDGALYGLAQFYAYDSAGRQTTWVGSLYNFQAAGKSGLTMQIIAPTGRPVLGKLTVKRSGNGDLTGQIQLGGSNYAISWHKLTQ